MDTPKHRKNPRCLGAISPALVALAMAALSAASCANKDSVGKMGTSDSGGSGGTGGGSGGVTALTSGGSSWSGTGGLAGTAGKPELGGTAGAGAGTSGYGGGTTAKGGAGGGSGVAVVDGGGADGETCGSTVCGAGTYCCNPACNQCVPVGITGCGPCLRDAAVDAEGGRGGSGGSGGASGMGGSGGSTETAEYTACETIGGTIGEHIYRIDRTNSLCLEFVFSKGLGSCPLGVMNGGWCLAGGNLSSDIAHCGNGLVHPDPIVAVLKNATGSFSVSAGSPTVVDFDLTLQFPATSGLPQSVHVQASACKANCKTTDCRE